MEHDKLNHMWEQQELFMHQLVETRGFPKFPVDLTSKDGQRFVKEMSHECMHELFEAIHLLKNSKGHRATQVQTFDRELFKEELADALHYFIEVCILAGITQKELYDAYMDKGNINFERIRGGY